MQSKFIKFSSILIILLSFSAHANDLTFNISGSTSTLNVEQDGQNNDIDFTANNFVSGTITIQQLNNNNDIDVTVTAGSGSGSWLTIYQNGSDSYNANLSCGHSWCGMTVDQR
jgi:hypothetical protein|tara:strand:- start:568 stop:906 length:339 start_codon:yes stop_codon:yes gene_type:complete